MLGSKVQPLCGRAVQELAQTCPELGDIILRCSKISLESNVSILCLLTLFHVNQNAKDPFIGPHGDSTGRSRFEKTNTC